MMSALGCCLINGIMPKKMKDGLINTYMESGTVRSNYLYINGIEITDNINHNPITIPLMEDAFIDNIINSF